MAKHGLKRAQADADFWLVRTNGTKGAMASVSPDDVRAGCIVTPRRARRKPSGRPNAVSDTNHASNSVRVRG